MPTQIKSNQIIYVPEKKLSSLNMVL